MLLSRGMKVEKCENAQKIKLILTIFVNFLYKIKRGDVVYAQQIRNIITGNIDGTRIIASAAWLPRLCVIARSSATWQSHKEKNSFAFMRLPRCARNDSLQCNRMTVFNLTV